MAKIEPPQTKYPHTIIKVIIVGLSSILAVCLIPAIIKLSTDQTLFKSDFYAGVLKKTNFYDQLPVLLGDIVMSSSTSIQQGGLLTGLDQEQFKWMMTSLLPPGWIEAETESAMASVLDFLNFETDTLTIIVDLQPIKDYLSSEQGRLALVNLLENLPDCTEEQLIQIMIAMQSGQGGFALCHPPLSELFNMDTMLDPVISSFLVTLPTSIILPPPGQMGIFVELTESPVFQIYRNVRFILALFPWICLILSTMIFLLTLRSIHWLTGSLGWPLVFASMAAAIPGLWLFLFNAKDLEGVIVNTRLGTLQGLEGLMVEVFQQGLHTAGQGLLIWSLGALTLGLVLLVVWFVTKK